MSVAALLPLPVLLPILMVGCRAAESAGPFAHEHHALAASGIDTPSVGVASSSRRWDELTPRMVLPDSPFTELVLSFNADVPEGSGLVADVKVSHAEGGATPWLRVASWGDVPDGWASVTESVGGRVAIDEVLLPTPGALASVRVSTFSGGGPVRGRRLDAVTTRPDPERDLSPSPGERIEWPVPFIGNTVDDPDLRSRLCSPTSLNMLVNHRATGVEHRDVVERIYSERFDLYGVWPRAIQTAWTFGVPGRLARFADWREVRAHLEKVGPIAISITAKRGEVRGMPYTSDSGHLIVLAGLTEDGDAIVIDPALRDEDEARRVYRAEDLTNVWLRRKRGSAYVLFEPAESGDSPGISGVEHPVEPPARLAEQAVGLAP